jgi:hypothetical protein
VTKAANPKKNKKAQKKKLSGKPVSAHSHSVAFGSKELLLVVKAFIKVTNNAKHSTDKMADKFWDEVYTMFEEFVASANKVNETNPGFSPIETGHGTELIHNCWQRGIKGAVQKFAGIIYNNPPTSGEIRDDTLVDLYNGRMPEEYSACSHIFPKTVQRHSRNL